mmetsp:Transcript_165292/g.401656  ORF Transcript_165292/g.401656 Transcript_165292/m.401656 type:complete len:498 (+) Transcript_165292:117-1610(+)
MNWPELSPETSQAIADVLKDVVRTKPKDVFRHVAQQLQDRSGLEPAAFEAHFEECKRRPRVYVLEERCPAGQDPFAWVTMRYNDDTILDILTHRAAELVTDILHEDPMEDTKALVDRACAAFPELMYLKDSPEELVAFQTLQAIYLGCSGHKDIDDQFENANPQLSFRCTALLEVAREHLLEPLANPEHLEALILCCALRVVGGSAAFQERCGGGHRAPELAVLHAAEHEAQALPSFRRMPAPTKQLIVDVLRVQFPFAMLISLEASPGHFVEVKEALAKTQGAIAFFTGVAATEHLVRCRGSLLADEAADLAKLGAQCLQAVEKYSAARAYELFLKKRAERHSWRLMKDDFLHRAIVRLCCFAGNEETEAWSAMMEMVEGLSDDEKDVLKAELARKDGVSESPVYVPVGAAELLGPAAAEGEAALRVAVRVLALVLKDASHMFDRLINHRTVRLRLAELAARARERGGAAALEGLPWSFEDLGRGEVAVRVAGAIG